MAGGSDVTTAMSVKAVRAASFQTAAGSGHVI
jgi:hypothetical protein